MLIGSHVSISGGLLGAAKEAVLYGANTFMVYTGAPQNSRRHGFDTFSSKMKINEGKAFMAENGISRFVVHAPYIINLATPKDENFEFGCRFLKEELMRTDLLGSDLLVLHPGSYTESSANEGIKRIAHALNTVLDSETNAIICLENMAGKGTELGGNFEELARIIDGVRLKDRVNVCFDTCHAHDSGFDIVNDLGGVMAKFDKTVGLNKLAVFHLNGSLNERGARKDRHANIGAGTSNQVAWASSSRFETCADSGTSFSERPAPKGTDKIGFEAIRNIAHSKYAQGRPLILETPWLNDKTNLYKEEIAALKNY